MTRKYDVLITSELFQKAYDILKDDCNLEIHKKDRPMTREELENSIKNKDGILTMLTERIDQELIELNPDLKIIANCAVGYDNINIDACNKYNIKVSNTPDILTNTTADFAWAMLMSLSRKVVEADKKVRNSGFYGWGLSDFLGTDINNKTLGIIGLGRIGQAVAKRAQGFNMNIIYNDVNRNKNLEEELNIEYKEFDGLLAESDYIIIFVPLLPSTKHLIGEEELDKMKDTAYLINIARGGIVDEKSLEKALKTNQIAGAALDVYENEPEVSNGLKELNNVILTPHIASASKATREKMAEVAARNLLSGLKDQEVENIVNPEVLQEG